MSGNNLQLSNYYTSAKAAPNALDLKCVVSKEQTPAIKSKAPDALAEMFARIEQKEKVYKQEREQAELKRKTNKFRILEDKLLRLCDSIKSMFVVQRIKVIRKNKLIKDLSDSQRGWFDNYKEISNNINHLSKASPKMFILKKHYKEGEMVKLSEKFKKSEMRSNIQKYIIELEKSSNEEQVGRT